MREERCAGSTQQPGLHHCAPRVHRSLLRPTSSRQPVPHPEFPTVDRATIEKLRTDNNHLKEELLLENKFSITPIDTIAGGRIVGMQDEADAMTRKARVEAEVVGVARASQRGGAPAQPSSKSHSGSRTSTASLPPTAAPPHA